MNRDLLADIDQSSMRETEQLAFTERTSERMNSLQAESLRLDAQASVNLFIILFIYVFTS